MPDGLNTQALPLPKDPVAQLAPIFNPDPARFAVSQLAAFQKFCAVRTGLCFETYASFDDFAVQQSQLFWQLFLEWCDLPWSGNSNPAWQGQGIADACFFPDVRLNFAECVLGGGRHKTDEDIALISCKADGSSVSTSWAELRSRVTEVALALHVRGLRAGDRVGAVFRNDDMAIITCLAIAALGASLSTSAPEMGVEAIVSRFARLKPDLIISHGSSGDDPELPLRVHHVAAEVAPRLGMILLGRASVPLPAEAPAVLLLSDIPWASAKGRAWARFDFNQPLFILFSSGTTGAPKCIVHGAGGTLIEHLKEHRLHCDLGGRDRLLFFTSTAWMMWNWQLSALAAGTTLVLYDGAVTGPETLWRIVEEHRVTVFGTSPPYLKLCADHGYVPARQTDLASLRAILSTGSILRDEQFDWVASQVKPVPLQSVSGGTDIIGCFVLGHPGLPVFRGEAQCRSLGLDVRAMPEDGSSAATEGELICANPFPSRPVGFLNDPDGKAFRAAYFAENPGVWTHGDLISVSPHGGFRMRGRSDGILNVRGIRIGPAEIYAALSGIDGIKDALAVEQVLPDGASRIVLLVVLQDATLLDDVLSRAIRRQVGERTSPAHVPAVLAQVSDLPTTHSGKRSERAASDAVNGRAIANRAALRNPEILEELANHSALQAPLGIVAGQANDPAASVTERLCGIWKRLFGFNAVSAEDDFFLLGGDSIMAISLFAAIEAEFGQDLPMSVLFHARTVAELAQLIEAGGTERNVSLVRVSDGAGRPVFAVHGMSGTVVEQRQFLGHLGALSGRPVYALQAYGLDQEKLPHRDIPAMAAHYIAALREVQPHGPYALCGYSFGGLVVYDMARQLAEAGERMDMLALLDSGFHPRNLSLRDWLRFRLGRFAVYRDAMAGMNTRERRAYLRQELVNIGNSIRVAAGFTPSRNTVATAEIERPLPPPLDRVRAGCELAYASYRPQPFPGPVILFHAERRDPRTCDSLPLWQRLASQLKIVGVAGSHHELVVGSYAQDLARHVAAYLGLHATHER